MSVSATSIKIPLRLKSKIERLARVSEHKRHLPPIFQPS